MRCWALSLAFAAVAAAQSLPTWFGNRINLLDPAFGPDGAVLFAAATKPDGTADTATNLYIFDGASTVRQLTRYSGKVVLEGVTSFTSAGGRAAFGLMPVAYGPEEVHALDLGTGAERKLASYSEGCPQPLCASCIQTCVRSVHLTADGGRALYEVSHQQPFRTAAADGSEQRTLPIYTGGLALSPQRVISRENDAVFTSSAPSGPTFAPAATDVYLMKLDGSDVRQVTRFGDPKFNALEATISADGSLIAFRTNYPSGQTNYQIWIVRPDGTGLRQISAGSDFVAIPSISADGSVVVFLQNGRIKRARTAEDGEVITLADLSRASYGEMVVSDDGGSVVFQAGNLHFQTSAVYRIPTDRFSAPEDYEPIYRPRFLNTDGVQSAATGINPPSPGGLISLYGVNLAFEDKTAGSGELPLSLNGLSVSVNGEVIPLLAVTPWQINAQLPQTVPPGPAKFQVHYADGGDLTPVSADVQRASPSEFAYAYNQTAALHAGTATPADPDHPAAAGEVLEVYCTGLGVTDPIVAAGKPSPSQPPARALLTPRLWIGGKEAQVIFAGLTPGLVGVYQVNVVVPSGLAPGLQYLSWREGGGIVYSGIAVK